VDSPRGTKRAKGKNSPIDTLNLNSLKMPALSHRQNQNRGFSRAQIHIISKKERKASRTNERTKHETNLTRGRTKKRESLLRQGAALRSSPRRRRRRRGNIKFALFFFIFDLSQFEFLCVCSWRLCVSLSLSLQRETKVGGGCE
jgi:hypothetical protein